MRLAVTKVAKGTVHTQKCTIYETNIFIGRAKAAHSEVLIEYTSNITMQELPNFNPTEL